MACTGDETSTGETGVLPPGSASTSRGTWGSTSGGGSEASTAKTTWTSLDACNPSPSLVGLGPPCTTHGAGAPDAGDETDERHRLWALELSLSYPPLCDEGPPSGGGGPLLGSGGRSRPRRLQGGQQVEYGTLEHASPVAPPHPLDSGSTTTKSRRGGRISGLKH